MCYEEVFPGHCGNSFPGLPHFLNEKKKMWGFGILFHFCFSKGPPKQCHAQVSYIGLKERSTQLRPWNRSSGDSARGLLEFFKEIQRRYLPDPKCYPNENSVFNSLNSSLSLFLSCPLGKKEKYRSWLDLNWQTPRQSSSDSFSRIWTAAQRCSLCSLLGHGPLHFTSLEDQCKDRKCQQILFVTKKQNVNHRKNRAYYEFCKSKEESRQNNHLRSREGEEKDHYFIIKESEWGRVQALSCRGHMGSFGIRHQQSGFSW